ncbi:hypothetical protein [Spirulina sp.]|uniref:hypothetical protein n=1 Tax=Spirulina sp. TaxID=1157 RepID=UPI003F72369D
MQITLDLPDEIAHRVSQQTDQLSQVLALGFRELDATTQIGFTGLAEVLEFLASLPTPEEILALRPSESLQTQITELLAKNRNGELTPTEQQLWQGYEYLEHLVRMAKARALLKLKNAENS